MLAFPNIKPIEASYCGLDKLVREFLYYLNFLLFGDTPINSFLFVFIINLISHKYLSLKYENKMLGARGKIIVSITHLLVVEHS